MPLKRQEKEKELETRLTTPTMASILSPLARSKILKPAGTPISVLEGKLGEAYVELEAHSKDFHGDMKSLQFYSAEEVSVSRGDSFNVKLKLII